VQTTGSDNVELLAAHIALLVLRAQVPGAREEMLYIISPATQATAAHEAAGVLAALPKPVELEGSPVHDAILIVHRSLTGALQARHREHLEFAIPSWRSVIQQRVDPDTATILIRRSGNPADALRIPFEALARWMPDYWMGHQLGGVWADPPPGTCGIIEVSEPPRFEARIEISHDT
jgi:hypothetical protein